MTKRARKKDLNSVKLIKDLQNIWNKYDLTESKKVSINLSKTSSNETSEPNRLDDKTIDPISNPESEQTNPENTSINRDEIKKSLGQGLNFYNKGEYKKAIDCFELVLNVDPENDECSEHLEKAIEQLDKEDDDDLENSPELKESVDLVGPEELAKMIGTSSYLKKGIDKKSIKSSRIEQQDDLKFLFSNPIIAEKIIQEMVEKGYFPSEYIHQNNDDSSNNDLVEDVSSNYLFNDKKNTSPGLGGIIHEITGRLEAEEKLKVLSSAIELLTEGITVSSLDGKLIFANNAFATMHGYSPEKVIGKPISTFHKAEQIQVMKAENSQNNESNVNIGENWHVKNDGTVFPISTRNSMFYNEDGSPVGLIGTHLDITRLKKSEIQIKKLGSAVEQSIDGIAICDLEMKLTYTNEAFAEIYGYSLEEIFDIRMEQLHNKKQLMALKKGMDKIKNEGSWKGEIGCIRKDGSLFPSFMSISLLRDEHGAPIGTLIISRDITDRKRMEKKLERYTEHLVEEVKKRTNELIQSEKMASLGQLVDGVAHELNNPLEFITLNTEIIDEYLKELQNYDDINIQQKINEITRLLETNLKGINRIIETTRALTRFALPTKNNKVLVNVNQGLKDTLNIFYNQYRHRIKIHEDYEDLPDIRCNIEQLNQVFMNIFLNSSQAMDQGDIWIRTRKKGKHVIIEIKDNGEGISSKNINRIFDPFFSTKIEGTGLGLSLGYRIVKAHEGDIKVFSKMKKGTKVKIKLPMVGK